jgi:hypothetical protein
MTYTMAGRVLTPRIILSQAGPVFLSSSFPTRASEPVILSAAGAKDLLFDS